MYYRVEVVIEHDENNYDSYSRTFEDFGKAKEFALGVDGGDPGDTVKVYIDDVIWKEYTV